MKKVTATLSIICGFLFGFILGILFSPKGAGINIGNITNNTNHYFPADTENT